MSNLWLWFTIKICLISVTFTESRYLRLPAVNCSELSPIGTSIIQLLNNLPASNWEFSFLTRTSVASYFLIDDLKGTVTVKRLLDREDLCRLSLCSCINECLLKLEINALSDNYTYIINLPIRILDENDNFCYFSNRLFNLNVSENARLNTRLLLPLAHDPDQAPNNVQYYSLKPNIYSELRFDDPFVPTLSIIKPLDREVRDRYIFELCAYEDSANLNRSCCTDLIVTVTDVNDNSPIFQHDQQYPLTVNISEETPIHTELIRIKAFDADDGLNGEIHYTFSKWTRRDATISKTFDLNSETGSLTLLRPLDYEKRNNYELQVQAKDRGPNSIPSYATVIIQVTDENDCTPRLLTFAPADVQLVNHSIFVLENISVGTPILYMTVSDDDSGVNGRVQVEFISNTNDILFARIEKISESTYSLLINVHLDREQLPVYSFKLIASDHGQPKRSIESLFELHLIDVNDCSPVFENSTNYSFSLDENNEENSILHTIEVFDPDEHDRLTLQLIFDTDRSLNELFKLNEQNQLIILKSLDYEKQSFYQFSIRAEDSIGHQTVMPITIRLNDLNDNPVHFTTNITWFEIEENQKNGTCLGHIQAEDADQINSIIYSIHPDDFYRIDKFVRLNSNGSLFTQQSFDREQIEQLEFRVIANDSIHADMMSIRIRILDQNDQRPVLKSSSPWCVLFNETNSNENIYLHFDGHDLDQDDNGRLSFSLINPSSSDIRLFSNGTLIVPARRQTYRFDLGLEDRAQTNRLSSLTKNFILLVVSDQIECDNYSTLYPIQLDQKTLIYLVFLIVSCVACFTLVSVFICFFYYWRQRQQKQHRKKHPINNEIIPNLTPSFSSSLNGEAENDTLLLSSPSPQFTAMTTVSTSTTTSNDSTRLTTFIDRTNHKSSSLSSSSSSTYVKMSRSFDDEML